MNIRVEFKHSLNPTQPDPYGALVILLHLSEESKDILKNRGINDLITETYQRPLFNYINFWKYLDLDLIVSLIKSTIHSRNIEESTIIRNEILKLFINGNTKFDYLYISNRFNYQIHNVPGAEHCLSELESFYCNANVNPNILKGLARICKSIKKLGINCCYITRKNSRLIKLIEVQKNLKEVDISHMRDKSFFEPFEVSLIKHADTIKNLKICWIPV